MRSLFFKLDKFNEACHKIYQYENRLVGLEKKNRKGVNIDSKKIKNIT